MKMVKQYLSYAAGAFGHDAFYATLSTYFMMFVTSQLFNTSDAGFNDKMIGWVTGLIVALRVVEIIFDPVIGGVVDNTRTRWGKFKPWLVVAGLISSVLLIVIFTDFGGLNVSHPVLYIILFGIVFITLDGFYSFKDVAFWSMLPALSLDSKKREKFGTIARFGSTLGQQGVQIVVIPLVTFFSLIFLVSHAETKTGWFWFAVVIAVVAYGGVLLTVFGTKEEDNIVRQNTEKAGIKAIFTAVAKNDQLMWQALSYFLFALAYVSTNSMLLYYFKYVMGAGDKFYLVGIFTAIEGIVAVSIFPTLSKFFSRRTIFTTGAIIMLIGYALFLFSANSLPLVLTAITLFFSPYPILFLVVLMTITDSVEYGQWKLGIRNESVTLSLRPLIDKLAGAFANGIVGVAAVAAGMTGSAKPEDITDAGMQSFNLFMFYIPIALIIISVLIYWFKVTLTEKKHAEIVRQLEERLRKEEAEKK